MANWHIWATDRYGLSRGIDNHRVQIAKSRSGRPQEWDRPMNPMCWNSCQNIKGARHAKVVSRRTGDRSIRPARSVAQDQAVLAAGGGWKRSIRALFDRASRERRNERACGTLTTRR
jgi:hypothetical protein